MRTALALVVVGAAAALWSPAALADPTLSLAGPVSPTNQTAAIFTFSSDAPDGLFECRLDSGDWLLCFSPQGYGGLGDGSHTFRVRVTSLLTGTAEAEHTWSVDTQSPPVPTITGGPSELVNETTATFAFDAVEATECSLDGGEFAACSSGVAYSGLGEGGHTFAVRATDAAGNASGATARSWTVDVTPPAATITSAPASLTQSRSASFAFVASESGATLRCSRDGAAYSTCTSPEGYSGLADGGHVFRVRARDAAGNLGEPDEYDWMIDGTDPTVTIASGPNGPVASREASFAFAVDEPATIACRLDESAFTSCSSPALYAGLADGPHVVTVRAVDAAGNAATAARSWFVDATPPVLSVPTGKVVEADAPSGSKVVYVVTGSDAGGALLPAAISCSPASGNRFPLGATTVTCTAQDGLGNKGTASFSVTVRDTTPPTINAPDVSVTATTQAGARRTDPAVAAYLNGVGATDLVSGVTLTNDAPDTLPVGQTRVVFTARDAAGNQSTERATITVLPRGTPAPTPDLTPPPDVRGASALAGDHRVTLTWAPPRRDFAYAVVQRSRTGRSAVTTYRGTARRHVVKGLRNDVQHRFVIVAYDRAGNRSRGVVLLATPKAQLLARPRPAARVSEPPLLRWAPVAGASYFNVQLWTKGRKVLSAWPVRAHLQLRAGWVYEGKRVRLRRGVYTWYVWPGIGPKSAAKYGTMLGKSTFVVVPDKRL